MTEFEIIRQEILEMRREQREDRENLFSAIRKERDAAATALAAERAIFMQEIKNLFANGCANAEMHKRNSIALEKQIADMERIRALLDKGQGVVWAVGAVITVISGVSGFLGSVLQSARGH